MNTYPLGPLIFTVVGLGLPPVLDQLMLPSVSTLGVNNVPYGPTTFTGSGLSNPASLVQDSLPSDDIEGI